MMQKEYYLGLDMGTSSVGWAVTDENYKLLRVKGKDLWGIREFEEAQTAAERRSKRISRRRRQREVARIGLLKEYFHDAITAKDSAFYQRLENSKYHLEDKDEKVQYKNGIFNDSDYQDKDYFRQYPTIFHLRKELILNPAEHDVRLVYLALLNMFKHRGHFLNAGISGEGNEKGIYSVYQQFCCALMEEAEISFPMDISGETIEEILSCREYSRTKKAEELAKAFQIDVKDKKRTGFVKAVCGLKVDAKLLFGDIAADKDKKIEICFSEFGYEEKIPEISETLGEKYYAIIEMMKEIYDIGVLANIMKGYSYLSEARVAEYDKHGNDLKILKRVLKRYGMAKEYNYFFRSDSAGTYSAYVKSLNSGIKRRREMKERGQEDLYKAVRKLLKTMPEDDADVKYIQEELEKENFLPKQLTASNGVIPNQVHVKEMRRILANAESYLPFLSKCDEYGLTVSERILQLFSFQIPYYVGPLSEKSKTGWVIRKEKGTVLPWNIEDKIDVKATSEEFISRMVRRCSYLNGEKVLPKTSLEYESFCVLNEINNIAIDGERIPVSLKQEIYNVLYKKGKKVTRKQLVNYLRAQGVLEDETQLTGIDESIYNSLSTYGRFTAIFGERMEEDNIRKMVEEIVLWCTIYGDSKKFLKERLEERYAEHLSSEQIKRITGLKFKDWGNLSKEFLEMQGCDKATGESVSLIRMMWETNLNLMELLNSPQYTYKEELESRQGAMLKTLVEIQPEDLDDYYFSAPVKRMVWQTLLIMKELEEVLGNPPKRLFVEMTRKPDEKKKRTVTRKQKFLDLYKNLQKEAKDWVGEIERADADGTLKSKKMYLYFTQKGRCMYTGEKIEIEKLFNDNLYDIDHIYPRHFVKDDNIDNNLVLVKKQVNAHKSDAYPLEESIYENQWRMWKELLLMGLITEEKYKRLTGRTAFTEEQQAGFIARQLVETSQGTKGVIDVLKQVLPPEKTTIVYSKAANVAEFRQRSKLVKCRSVNEFHHAQDAYLNIVVGNVYYVKFTQNPLNFIQKEYKRDSQKYKYHLSRMFDWDVVRGKETAWVGPVENGAPGTIATVKEMLKKNTPIMTRRNFEGHGGIANETLYSAKKAKVDNYMALKASDKKLADVTKYGGYTSMAVAYFFLVEHGGMNKRIRTLEAMPIYLKEKLDGNEKALLEYCENVLGLVNPSIRLPKIKIQSLIKRDGYFMYISGKTGNRIALRNAVNLCLKPEWFQYVKKLEKYSETKIVGEGLSKEQNIELYMLLLQKHQTGIYAKRPNPMGEKLLKRSDRFRQLDVGEQCGVLVQLLQLTAIGIPCADLSLLNEAPKCGVMLMPKKLNEGGELLLVNQSVTGIFESRIDLLTV